MLETVKLTKHYGKVLALDQLDLKVAKGEVYALLGANGAGKTTTIQHFLGFLRPDSGSVKVAGREVGDDVAAARQLLAYIPEQVNLYPTLSGVENLGFFSRLAGSQLREDELRSYLQRVGLATDVVERPVGSYSKGMRQKVGIAIALAKKATALILDEPTSGLDPKASHEFSRLLLELAGEGVASLMATHDLFRAKEVAERIGILRRGRLVSELRSREVGHAELEEIYLREVEEVAA